MMFPVCMAPGLILVYQKNSTHTPYYSRPKKQLESCLSMNEAWMNECTARLLDQYKPIQHQTVAIEKFRDLIVTTRSCPGDKKSFSRNCLTRQHRFSTVYRVSKKNVICGAWCKIVTFLYNSPVWCFFNIF